jgi:formate dehydrogenase
MFQCTETETIKLLLQLRYAAGVKDMLERYFKGQDFPEPNYIVKAGKLASQYQ